MATIVVADPSDQVWITLDWSAALGAGVTFSGNVIHSVNAPLVKLSELTNSQQLASQVKVSGMLHGGLYLIEGQVLLSTGETLNRQFPVRGFNA